MSLLPYCTIAILRIERLENYMFCSKEKYEELSSSRTNISFSNPFLLLFLLYTKRLFIHVDVEYRVQTMIYTFKCNIFKVFLPIWLGSAAAKTNCNYPFYDAESYQKAFVFQAITRYQSKATEPIQNWLRNKKERLVHWDKTFPKQRLLADPVTVKFFIMVAK